ncbi:MAG: hypothetical protein IKR85_10035 [Clostridia bacterium]|nr:hypothetical protein [Clostridia bacterium]
MEINEQNLYELVKAELIRALNDTEVLSELGGAAARAINEKRRAEGKCALEL